MRMTSVRVFIPSLALSLSSLSAASGVSSTCIRIRSCFVMTHKDCTVHAPCQVETFKPDAGVEPAALPCLPRGHKRAGSYRVHRLTRAFRSEDIRVSIGPNRWPDSDGLATVLSVVRYRSPKGPPVSLRPVADTSQRIGPRLHRVAGTWAARHQTSSFLRPPQPCLGVPDLPLDVVKFHGCLVCVLLEFRQSIRVVAPLPSEPC